MISLKQTYNYFMVINDTYGSIDNYLEKNIISKIDRIGIYLERFDVANVNQIRS
jgi:hypothetical protein